MKTSTVARVLLAALMVVAAGAVAQAPHSTPFPDHMVLSYRVYYGPIPVGISTRTLDRSSGNTYDYSLHSFPTGAARLFTHLQWFEKGRFRVVKDQVYPLEYLKYRVGSRNARRKEAKFDWNKGRIVYADHRSQALPAGTQDENTVIFELMLHPPSTSVFKELHITTGSQIITYKYKYLRTEVLDSALGRLRTTVVYWAEQTRHGHGKEFTAWLALDRHNIPVRIVARDDGQTASMLIRNATGI
ncbi:MAG: DUF3108 domain-containing protein [Acidiferrobacterales bacterium]